MQNICISNVWFDVIKYISIYNEGQKEGIWMIAKDIRDDYPIYKWIIIEDVYTIIF